MSAFFVDLGTIDDAVAAFAETQSITGDEFDPDRIGRELLELNAEALRQRYRLDVEAPDELAGYLEAARAYRYHRHHPDGAQRWHSCACLAYQCAEGDVPKRALLLALDDVTAAMLRRYGRKNTNDLIWNRTREAETRTPAPRTERPADTSLMPF